MSRISEVEEAQKKISTLIEDYPEYYDPQNVQLTYLYEIAKSLAVIADVSLRLIPLEEAKRIMDTEEAKND